MANDLVLVKIDTARRFLEQAIDLQQVKEVIAIAEAASVYAKRMDASMETRNYAEEVRGRAERKFGEIWKGTPKAKGGQPAQRRNCTSTKLEPVENTPTLAELGINKKDASRALLLASVSPSDFEKIIAVEPETELNIKKAATNIARKRKETKRKDRREKNKAKVAATPDPIASGAKFATIVIDPPWDWGDEGDQDQLGRARPTYATMTIDQLLKLPVAKLTDTDCHIYLWITNRSLPKGFTLLEKWGFRYVTCLTWCKPSIGMGNYFRGSTEQVLFGVKGSQPLKRKNVGTWFAAPRGKQHSSKPVEFMTLVESCSPGPYLEMFSRKARPNWSAWGADVPTT